MLHPLNGRPREVEAGLEHARTTAEPRERLRVGVCVDIHLCVLPVHVKVFLQRGRLRQAGAYQCEQHRAVHRADHVVV